MPGHATPRRKSRADIAQDIVLRARDRSPGRHRSMCPSAYGRGAHAGAGATRINRDALFDGHEGKIGVPTDIQSAKPPVKNP